MMKPRNAFSPRQRVVAKTGKPSRAKQSFKDQCDVNQIIDTYDRTGLVSHLASKAAFYDDLVNDGKITGVAEDYHAALCLVTEAQSAFNALPSPLRARFKNDPAEFIAFCDDPANLDEMRELGLARPLTPAEAHQRALAAEAAVESEASQEPAEAGDGTGST